MKRRTTLAAMCLYILALILMHGSVPRGVERETVRIDGPDAKPCMGTIWAPPTPKAAILLGHGITSNQGVMTVLANTFNRNGFVAVTLDFWGHGRSREEFDWFSNAAQIHAWCAWAKQRFPGLPLAYLGHSMGGFAGGQAFNEKPDGVDAFVALGALPNPVPPCKTLVAAGRFEELFSPEEARQRVAGKADVVSSPFSDHMLEVTDPLLLQRIVAWVNGALGFERQCQFPWISWAMSLMAALFGCVTAFMLAESAAVLYRRPPRQDNTPLLERRSSANPYRLAARLLGYRGNAIPLRSQSLPAAMVSAIVFSAVLTVLLSWILGANVFTCSPDHPVRLLMWLVLIPITAIPLSLGGWAAERAPLPNARARFAVSALTRAVPILLLTVILRLISPHLAFGCMMLVIFTLVLVVLSAVHALATRAAGDYRAGIVASSIVAAWVIAFWLPLIWT